MRFLKPIVIVAAAVLLASCSLFRSKESVDSMPQQALYQRATNSLASGDYAAAERSYQRLIARFPAGQYTEQAQIDLAFAQYKDNKPDDAYSTINRFIRTYPTAKHIDYAYYLRGLINFNRSVGVIERFVERDQSRRDQGFRLKAFDDFSELVRRFPGSSYAKDARQRMIWLRNGLAQHEVDVAKFYLRNKAYVAAADRAQYVIEHYQQSPQVDDALAILARCYKTMGLDKLADQTVAVLKLNDPKHPYLSDPNWPHHASTLRRAIPFSGHH